MTCQENSRPANTGDEDEHITGMTDVQALHRTFQCVI